MGDSLAMDQLGDRIGSARRLPVDKPQTTSR
jgi:hypothetical protein